MGWSTGHPTAEGYDALNSILTAAKAIADPALRVVVLPYVQAHVGSCRNDVDHPWAAPAGLGCSNPANPDNTHAAFGDAELTTSLVRAAANAAGAQTAAQWCIVIFDLDHAGGGGDNRKGTYRRKKSSKPKGH